MGESGSKKKQSKAGKGRGGGVSRRQGGGSTAVRKYLVFYKFFYLCACVINISIPPHPDPSGSWRLVFCGVSKNMT